MYTIKIKKHFVRMIFVLINPKNPDLRILNHFSKKQTEVAKADVLDGALTGYPLKPLLNMIPILISEAPRTAHFLRLIIHFVMLLYKLIGVSNPHT